MAENVEIPSDGRQLQVDLPTFELRLHHGRQTVSRYYRDPHWIDLGYRGITISVNSDAEEQWRLWRGATGGPSYEHDWVDFWNWRVVEAWRMDKALQPRLMETMSPRAGRD